MWERSGQRGRALVVYPGILQNINSGISLFHEWHVSEGQRLRVAVRNPRRAPLHPALAAPGSAWSSLDNWMHESPGTHFRLWLIPSAASKSCELAWQRSPQRSSHIAFPWLLPHHSTASGLAAWRPFVQGRLAPFRCLRRSLPPAKEQVSATWYRGLDSFTWLHTQVSGSTNNHRSGPPLQAVPPISAHPSPRAAVHQRRPSPLQSGTV